MKSAGLYLRNPVTRQDTLLGALEAETAIGRSETSPIRVDDLRCSGIHALIERRTRPEGGDDFIITDLGSHYGTFVNGKKIQEASIQLGESFKIGNKLLVLKAMNGTEPPLPQTQQKPQIQAPREESISLLTDKNLLQVSLHWGDTILDVRTFTAGSDVTLGSSQDSTFAVTFIDPRLQKHSYRVARYRAGQLQLRLPAEASGLVWIGNETFALDTLRHKDKGSREFGELEVFLRVGDRADIHIGELTLSFRFVNPALKVPFSFWNSFDFKLTAILGALLVLFSGVLLYISTTPVVTQEKTLKDVPQSLRRIVFDAGIEKALKRQKAAIGQLAQNLQGGRAQGDEGRAKGEKSPTPPAPKKVQKTSGIKARAEKPKGVAVAKVDLDAAFSMPNERPLLKNVSIVGKSESGNTATALAGGGFARGTRGEGSGGGGKSVGIGQLTGNSTGGGMGAGDYGLAPSKGREIKIPDSEEVVILGGLDPDIISAVIKRYLPQIQHCYEQQLAQNPDLKGKVTVSFVISGTGSVKSATVAESSLKNQPAESCIISKVLEWQFPKPKGGGSVGVKYPFLLMSNTGG